jgi:hypothetical protein
MLMVKLVILIELTLKKLANILLFFFESLLTFPAGTTSITKSTDAGIIRSAVIPSIQVGSTNYCTQHLSSLLKAACPYGSLVKCLKLPQNAYHLKTQQK